MERNPRPFDYDPAEPGGPAMQPRQEFSRAAGHITLGESEHRGRNHAGTIRAPESVIDAALESAYPRETRRSEWLNYVVDTHTGEMVDRQQKGQAFVAETRAEAASGQTPQTPLGQVSYGSTQAVPPTMPQTLPNEVNYTVPASGFSPPSNLPLPTPVGVSQAPAVTDSPVRPTPSSNDYNAPAVPAVPGWQPGSQPVLPPALSALQHPEPALPPGPHVDEQHLLAPPQNIFLRILKSPWLWLGVGILMILYFGLG